MFFFKGHIDVFIYYYSQETMSVTSHSQSRSALDDESIPGFTKPGTKSSLVGKIGNLSVQYNLGAASIAVVVMCLLSFAKLTNIGEAFLSCCPVLESLNISVLKNITGIGNCYSDGRYYFLSGCSEVLLGGFYELNSNHIFRQAINESESNTDLESSYVFL